MYPHSAQAALRRFFTGLAEFTFQARLGVVDPPMVDYLAELLARFVHADALHTVRTPVGRRLTEVAEMAVEAEHRNGEARRAIHRHIGDYTLFWTGVYPEALKRLRRADRLDHFIDYCQQGKRSYLIASQLGASDKAEESQVLERISREFELCVYGLGEIRKQWESGEDNAGPAPPGPLLFN